MGDWPGHQASNAMMTGIISIASVQGGMSANTPAGAAWPAANLAFFYPIPIDRPTMVTALTIAAGVTAAGNFDLGIYDAWGNLLVSTGATAKGASVEHVIPITPLRLGRGLYYLASSADGTNNYVAIVPASTGALQLNRARSTGQLRMASAYVLPSTATFAALTTGDAYIPLVGMVVIEDTG